MCGVAGGVGLRPDARPDAERVRRMTCLVAHRGPDGEGHWRTPEGRVVFGHRRLSVIDLATGDQPMIDETGRAAIVFNGEIYNYRELRRDLEAQGVAFRTASDTEVLLRLYLRDGPSCVRLLRGMFAFAVWDGGRERFVLARDRVGKKPLYYVTEDNCLYFASSLSALRDTRSREWKIDLEAIDAFLRLGYIPAPLTAYAGVRKLAAGTLVTVDRFGMQEVKYWRWADAIKPFEGTFDQAADRLDEHLQESVRLRLRSDVPLGMFLSGGVDSSLVAAVATRQLNAPLRTFSIGFEDPSFDESPYAARVAEHIGSEHRAYRARSDLLHHLPDMVRHYGEPYGDSSALATWLLASRTREQVTVALNGDGGDEGFGGYDWYRTALRLRALRGWAPMAAWRLAGRIARSYRGGGRWAGRLRRALAVVAQHDDRLFSALRSFVSLGEAGALYAGELAAVHRAPPPPNTPSCRRSPSSIGSARGARCSGCAASTSRPTWRTA